MVVGLRSDCGVGDRGIGIEIAVVGLRGEVVGCGEGCDLGMGMGRVVVIVVIEVVGSEEGIDGIGIVVVGSEVLLVVAVVLVAVVARLRARVLVLVPVLVAGRMQHEADLPFHLMC